MVVSHHRQAPRDVFAVHSFALRRARDDFRRGFLADYGEKAQAAFDKTMAQAKVAETNSSSATSSRPAIPSYRY
jgi:hypothetical protein